MSLISQIVGAGQAAAVIEEVVPPLFGMARGIAEAAEGIRVNKDSAQALARGVDQLVSTLALNIEAGNPIVDDVTTRDFIIPILTEIQETLQARASQSYISQLLRQHGDSETLRALSARLQDAYDILAVKMHAQLNHSVSMAVQAREASDAFNALRSLSTVEALTGPPRTQLPTGPTLPPQPRLYFGRTSETQLCVESLSVPRSSYVCILGGPGMGKTSLALAVLHSSAVVARYEHRRYFVSCEGADERLGVLNVVAAAFGITNFTRAIGKTKLAAVFTNEPTLVVLDNLESVWDSPNRSTDVEDDLAYLSSITGLSLVVTLRGSERPQGVPWTRPFLSPLEPLDPAAARQLFVSISDVTEDSVELDRLLAYFDNIPLAVALAACLAQYESITSLLAQWDESKSSMLRRSDGRHRLTSLDASIALSLESSRMNQARSARQLLSLLALLPHGAFSTDISLWACSLPDVSHAISALVQNALVWRTSDDRIRVLAPIREYMLLHHPPQDSDVRPLYTFYFGILGDLSPSSVVSNIPPEATAIIAPELENLRFLVIHALNHSVEPRAPITAAVALSNLFDLTGLGSPDVLHPALAVARRNNLDQLAADLLFTLGVLAYNSVMPGDPVTLMREALSLFEKAGDINGRINCTITLSVFLEPQEAATECQRMCDLAEAMGCDKMLLLRCQSQLAITYKLLLDFDRARNGLEHCIAVYKSMGKAVDRQRGYNMIRLAELDMDVGDLAHGIAVFREAADILLAAHSPNVEAALLGLGSAYLIQGDAQCAVEALTRLLFELRSSENMARSFECLYYLTSAYLAIGDTAAAAATVALADEQSLSLAPERVYERGCVLLSRGQLAFAQDRLDDATILLRMAVALTRAPNYYPIMVTQLEADVWEVFGQMQQHRDLPQDALSSFVVAALLRRRIGYTLLLVRALTRLAQVVDDDTSEVLLGAIMLPLQRFGCRALLGECLIHSGKIAARQGYMTTARHRWGCALKHFEAMKASRSIERSRALLAMH
ncbi:hypothetical protein EXIGLDRAFT_830624 [Exidia glandulosa HHB12029]|uniref:AAA+ ATPase domain-containing protein n=1 Tax=Exidia glandulosa HHB12029 TaxID=1314781 RepID=A0A165NH91_EXIGL|nr:hypothetical protein EXIGLDRAFT_830624 [Exidia glandulosa HHB12029]